MEISVSRLKTYLSCPQLYRYRYLTNEEPEFTPADMLYGEAMHHAVAEYHRSENTLNAEQMTARFTDFWEASLRHGAQIQREIRFRSDDQAVLVDKAQALCGLYVEQFQTAQADDVELLFQVPLLDPNTGAGNLDHSLTGRIDLVANRSVYEFKTSSRSYAQSEADTSIQLTAYALAYEYLYDSKPEHLYLVALVKTKQPKIQIVETTRSLKDFQFLMEMAEGIAQAIEAEVFFRNLEYQYGCHSCDHCRKCVGAKF